MDEGQKETRLVEAVKLLSEYAKWLITVETTAVGAIGYVLTVRDPFAHGFARAIAFGAVISFVVSILLVTGLLRSLPSIILTMRPGQNIWDAKDKSVLTLGLSTSQLTTAGTVSFAAGIVLVDVTLLVKLADT